MAFSMGNQFTGLPMQELIGAPLNAAADAQVRLANSTAEFIQQIGFRPSQAALTKAAADKKPVEFDPATFDIRTVAFKFDRATGPADDKGVIPTEQVSLDVPLLAIVNIPALGIQSVDIIFDMEVKNSESSKESLDKSGKFSADASIGWGVFSLKVHVEGSVSSHKETHVRPTRAQNTMSRFTPPIAGCPRGWPACST